jgi:hypothetical protein
MHDDPSQAWDRYCVRIIKRPSGHCDKMVLGCVTGQAYFDEHLPPQEVPKH